MFKHCCFRRLLLISLMLTGSNLVSAEQLRIAVASNFIATMKVLAKNFQRNSTHRLLISPGSTGKHYAQIINGAPFDLFLAADVKRPALLEQQGLAVNGTRFTYAIGQLVLWSPQPGLVDPQGQVLHKMMFRHLAIANPRLAPYGRAAREVLEAMQAWPLMPGRLVTGENISQAYQFVKSGNAELGLIAYSQIKHDAHATHGSHWLIPRTLYQPIEQQLVLLRDTPAARDFIAYLQSTEALKIIQHYGYDTP